MSAGLQNGTENAEMFHPGTQRSLSWEESNGDGTSLEDDGLDLQEAVIICFEVIKGKFGAALLDCHTRTLKVLNQDYILNVTTDSTQQLHGAPCGRYVDEVNMITESLITEAKPTVCLLSARLEEASYNFIESICKKMNCQVELQPSQSFKNGGELKLLKTSNYKDLTLLNDLILNDTSNATTAGTVSCILTKLKRSLDVDMSGINSSANVIVGRSLCENTFISHFESLQLKDRVFLDEDTLFSLNIFPRTQNIGHDKLVRNGCLSVFELLNHTSSELGRRLLKSWLVSPLAKKRSIEKRYEIIRILTSKTNTTVFEDLRHAIKGFPDVFNLLNQFQNGKANLITWCTFIECLKKGIDVYNLVSLLNYNAESSNIFTLIQNGVNISTLSELLRKIESIIDVEASKETKSITIHDGVDPRLDEYKHVYNDLEEILENVAKDVESVFARAVVDAASDITKDNLINAVYIPQLGYLVAIDVSLEPLLQQAEGVEWEEIFRTSTNIYYKNDRVLKLDVQFGDVYGLISDLEIEILFSLQNEILKEKEMICAYRNILAEVEVLLSFAYVSVTRNYVEPELSETECVLEVYKGRHALYETLVESYIPNNINLDGGRLCDEQNDENWFENGYKKIAIVTGANQSGKSVFLTQNGLIIFLAQIGCFVPAERAKIGLVDKILTRIRARETISKSQSSFALDSQQMAKCLSLMTERSLILVDEFGKGTDVIDGPAIFGSIICTLAKTKQCPRIISCTHFHELFKSENLTENIPGIIHYATDILLNNTRGQSLTGNTIVVEKNFGITFLYSVKEGISKQSFGIYCAKICGVEKSIVSRAEELASWLDEGYDMVDYCGNLLEDEIAEFRNNQDIVKSFISWDLDLESTTNKQDLKEKLQYILEG